MDLWMRFRRFHRSRENGVLASSCLSVSLSVPARLPLDGFSWKFILRNSTKICRGTPYLVKIGHSAWRRKYIYCWLHYEVFCCPTTSSKVNHCSISMVKMVTRTRNSVTFYVHCLACFLCVCIARCKHRALQWSDSTTKVSYQISRNKTDRSVKWFVLCPSVISPVHREPDRNRVSVDVFTDSIPKFLAPWHWALVKSIS